MLAQYLETGDLDAAMAIFNHPTVTNVTLSEVLTTTSENTRLMAQVLSVKKPKPKKFQKDGNKFSRVDKQYDRLVLLRELTEGDLFYLLTETPMDTRQLFIIQNYTWIGATVGLFEAEYQTMLNHVPIIKIDQPLLPIKATVIHHITRPFVAEYSDKLIPRALYINQATLTVTKANVINGCGADFCDSQHNVNTKRVIQCRITSTEANISNTPFTSASFSRLFLSEHAMKTTSAQIPMLEFRNHVREVLRYYADRGVTWQISGWYKPGLRANDEQVREPKFHVTCITPERVLENAPLFNVVLPDVERQVLQAAIQRPCHQRVLAPHQQRPQPNPDAQQQRQQPQAAPQQQRQQPHPASQQQRQQPNPPVQQQRQQPQAAPQQQCQQPHRAPQQQRQEPNPPVQQQRQQPNPPAQQQRPQPQAAPQQQRQQPNPPPQQQHQQPQAAPQQQRQQSHPAPQQQRQQSHPAPQQQNQEPNPPVQQQRQQPQAAPQQQRQQPNPPAQQQRLQPQAAPQQQRQQPNPPMQH